MSSSRRSQPKAGALEPVPAVSEPPPPTLEEKALATDLRRRHLEELHRRFRGADLPAFEAWMETEFGRERAETGRLQERLNKLRQILLDAEKAWLDGETETFEEALAVEWAIADAKAAAKAKAKEKGGDHPFDEEAEEEMEELFESFMMDVRGIDVDDLDPEDYEKARADFVEGMGRAAAGDKAGFEKLMARAGADESTDNVRAVKAIYRRLAKKLHPDQSGSWDETEKQLWDDASAAYESLNLEELKRIELQLCLHRGEEIPAARKGELRAWLDRLLKAISALEKDLREMRRHPAWGFAKRRQTKAFREKIRKELEVALRLDRERVARLEEEIGTAVQRRFRRKRAASRRRKPRSGQRG